MGLISDKLILTDCDGVLLDWEFGFDQWVKEHHGLELKIEGVYGLTERYGIDKNHTKELVKLFNESAAIGFLPAMRDSIKYVKKLHEEGFIFGVITSMTEYEYSVRLRNYNLEQVFGPNMFYFMQSLDIGADKDDALEPYRDTGCYWIEDKAENAILGAEMGLESLLMSHEHNKHVDHEDITHVDNWKHVYEVITG